VREASEMVKFIKEEKESTGRELREAWDWRHEGKREYILFL